MLTVVQIVECHVTAHFLILSCFRSGVEREYSAVVLGEVNPATLSDTLLKGVQTADGKVVAKLVSAKAVDDKQKVRVMSLCVRVLQLQLSCQVRVWMLGFLFFLTFSS